MPNALLATTMLFMVMPTLDPELSIAGSSSKRSAALLSTTLSTLAAPETPAVADFLAATRMLGGLPEMAMFWPQRTTVLFLIRQRLAPSTQMPIA